MRLGSKTSLRCAWAVWVLPAGAAFGQALPAGGSFSSGSGSIASGPASVTVNQSSARGVINWSGFSIGAGGTVTFNNGAGATLNRVTGAKLSSIAGELDATGSVFLVNPNGVVVQAGGKVVTGGSFVASARDVADSQFMAGGTLDFAGNSAGAVTNLGAIVSRNGDVVLIGAAATNNGIVSAPHGTAALAAGNQVLMADVSGPSGIYVAPDTAATGNVTNTGAIKAAAAALASAGGNVYALAGNRNGLIAATGDKKIAGQVWLTTPDGAVAVSGTVKAANPNGGGAIIATGGSVALADTAVLDAAGRPGQPGGTVETSGGTLALGDATVNAGQGGNWLVDPETLTIGTAAAGAIDTALDAGTNVTEETTASIVADGSNAGTVTSGAGDIDVAAPLAWNSSATLTLSAFNNVNIEAPISIAGNGGLAITTGQGAALNFFSGGAIDYPAGADTNAAPLTINGAAYSLVFSSAQLQEVGSGDYALANDLNETGVSGFVPIGETTPFTGIFNGLGNSIANLTIDDTADPFVGLFGQIGSGGAVENLGLAGGSVTGGEYAYAGGLAGGVEAGTVRNSYATVTVSGGSDNGGLVGFADGATIADSYAAGAEENGAYAGGLVAFAVGGTVQNSYAAGSVVGGVDAVVGGLVGYDGGVDITDSYATGAATGGMDASVGGLVGLAAGGTIEDAYATAAVTGGSEDGGLVGDASGASATDDYYDTTTTGIASGPGTGLSTSQWLAEGPTVPGSPYSFVNQSAWLAGAPYPVLAALPYLIVTQSGAQVYGGTASHAITGITDPAGNDATSLVNLAGFSTLTNVTSASDVGAYALGGAGASAAGYQIDYAGSLTVTPAPLTITLGNQSSVYGQTPALNDAGYVVTGTLYNGDTLTGVMLATNATSASPVGGGYTVFATGETGTGLGNYDIMLNDGVFSVTPATLAITANAQSFTYGQTPGLGDTAFSTNGLVNGDSVIGVSLTTNATALSTVGGYTITPSAAVGTGLGNYDITYETGPLTIDPAALTITAGDQQSTYGQTPSLGDADFTTNGLVASNGDSVSSVTLTTEATASSPVGNYTITPSGALGTGLGNYTITYNPGTLTIDPAALTITANDQSSTYGQTQDLGDIAFITSGLLNGDTADSVTLTSDATSASAVGSYTITPSAAAGSGLGNYTITYNFGTLTIDPAALTITADDVTKDAGATIDLGDTAFTAAGLANGDSVNAVTLTSDGTGAGASVQDSPYAIVPSGAVGSGLSNYAIAYVDGALTVEATVSIDAVAEDAVYLPDGNDIAVSQVLQSGPTSNAPAALPLIISQADAASVTATSGGLAISTGLPLAGQADETSLLGDRGRHLQVSLPPTAPPASGGGL